MNTKQQAKWEKVRARGETWFIVKTALLADTLFVGLMSLAQYCYSSRGFQGRHTASLAASQFLFWVSMGLTEWHKRESEYAKATGASPPATLWQKIQRVGPLFYIVPYGVLTGLITASVAFLYDHLFDRKYTTTESFFTDFLISLLVGLLLGIIFWMSVDWIEQKSGATASAINR